MHTQTRTNVFPGLLNDFVNLGFEKIFNDDFGTPNVLHQSPVNIIETAEAYHLDMVAPGREKADFSISLDKNLLTISYTKKEEVKEEGKKLIRKEFSLQSFKRTFTLSQQVDATKISATYVNGILTVTVAKKEVVTVAPTTIEIL
jgi:HSP20 family protein